MNAGKKYEEEELMVLALLGYLKGMERKRIHANNKLLHTLRIRSLQMR